MKQLIIILLFSYSSLGQGPTIEWQKSLGGSNQDASYSIQHTSDGGYIVAGWSTSNDGDVTSNNGSHDYWIIKLTNTGDISWQKSFGGSDEDNALSIEQTTDGGYIVAGYSYSNDGDVTGNHGGPDYLVVKLDNVGNISWQKSLGGSNQEYTFSIQATYDGGYIVAGLSLSNDGDVTGNHGFNDCWVVKLDDVGNINWQKSLGGSGDDRAWSIQQTADSGYIVAGSSNSIDGDVTGNNGGLDYWVVKLANSGSIEWEKSMGGSLDESPWSIEQTTDGGYIVAGWSFSNNGDVTGNNGGKDYWVVKLDTLGDISWQKSMGGSYEEIAYSIRQTIDGGYIIAGSSASNDGDVTSNNGDLDNWIIKLNNSGNIDWQKSMGGSNLDFANSILSTTDGGYIVVGPVNSGNGDVTGYNGNGDCWIVKLGPDATFEELLTGDKELLKICNLLGQETEDKPNTSLLYVYSDGSIEKVYRIE